MSTNTRRESCCSIGKQMLQSCSAGLFKGCEQHDSHFHPEAQFCTCVSLEFIVFICVHCLGGACPRTILRNVLWDSTCDWCHLFLEEEICAVCSWFGNMLAFSQLAALLIRRCGFPAGHISSSCFMFFGGSSCHWFSTSTYVLICSPFVN